MKTAEYWIGQLKLEKHPEGGCFSEHYRSSELISRSALPERFSGDRVFSTCIYFLLTRGEFSAFHRIQQDEIWHFYDGASLYIHIIEPDGGYRKSILGCEPESGAFPQVIVPAGAWFAAEPAENTDFCLCGCTVAPGFDFADFEMPGAETLIAQFPNHSSLLERLGG